MNATSHYPSELELSPSSVKCARAVPETLCHLRMRYGPEGQWQSFHSVWVPTELQKALKTGQVQSLHLETLEPNGPVTQALGYPADFLVMGVSLSSGERISGVPHALHKAKWLRVIGGGLAVLAGAACLSFQAAWTGAVVLVIGSHLLRTALRIPLKPLLD